MERSACCPADAGLRAGGGAAPSCCQLPLQHLLRTHTSVPRASRAPSRPAAAPRPREAELESCLRPCGPLATCRHHAARAEEESEKAGQQQQAARGGRRRRACAGGATSPTRAQHAATGPAPAPQRAGRTTELAAAGAALICGGSGSRGQRPAGRRACRRSSIAAAERPVGRPCGLRACSWTPGV